MAQSPFKPILLDLLHKAQLAQAAFLGELDAAEYAAPGTPDHWSAKDHVAHMTFWQQQLSLKLTAILHHETPPDSEDFELLNPQVFEEQRLRPWPEVLAESEQIAATLLTLIQQFSEEDLVAFDRFAWISDHEPLYTRIMGSTYEHVQTHLAQYYLDRQDLPRAVQIYETWSARVVQTEAPDALKGISLYNLACFYATHEQLEKAAPTLEQSLQLYPHLTEWSLADPDLIALRPDQLEPPA